MCRRGTGGRKLLLAGWGTGSGGGGQLSQVVSTNQLSMVTDMCVQNVVHHHPPPSSPSNLSPVSSITKGVKGGGKSPPSQAGMCSRQAGNGILHSNKGRHHVWQEVAFHPPSPSFLPECQQVVVLMFSCMQACVQLGGGGM